jgi:hypothetical protein
MARVANELLVAELATIAAEAGAAIMTVWGAIAV